MKIISVLVSSTICACCQVSLCLADNNFTSSIFIDTYSAYSQNKLLNDQRPYFTQSIQNNDYHLNLASAGLGFDNGVYRSKLVGQYGDSVSVNYNAEPEDTFKYIQESYLGLYLNDATTIDVGTFLAHIGAESWLSKDNLNYSRSFIAEFSPYYETGVRISHKFNDQWSAQLLAVNGWQNTSDNRHPALGTQVSYNKQDLTLTSNTFIGAENYGTRLFHDFIVSQKFASGLVLLGSIDVGNQFDSSIVSGTWWGYSLMAKQPLTERLSINGRFEYYQDPNGVIVTSVTDQDFKSYGASIGIDISLGLGLIFRSEVKQLWAPDSIFLDNQAAKDSETIFVVSLSFFDERTL